MPVPQVGEFKVRCFSPDFMPDEPSSGPHAIEELNVRGIIQGMFNRTGFSYHKYGSISDNFPHHRTGIANARRRMDRYEEEGNTEDLVDAMNYLLIEIMRPSHPNAHFEAKDSDQSPGAINIDGSVHHGKDS